MFRKLFDPDSDLMVTMTWITDCIFLSLFWLLGCAVVITTGASCAALYDAVFRGFRGGEKHCWKRFVNTFRCNWKAGIVPTVVFLAAFGGLVYILINAWNGAVYGTGSWAVFAGVAVLAVLVLGILSVMFPMLSRFENSFSALMKNTVLLALANLPRTFVLGALWAVTVVLCVRFIIPVFFLPALATLLSSYFIEPMFKPYLNEDAAA